MNRETSIILVVLISSLGVNGYQYNQNTQLNNQLLQLTISNSDKDNEIANLQTQRNLLFENITALEDATSQLVTEKSILEENLSTVESEKSTLENQIVTFQETVDELQNEKSTLETSLESKKASLRSVEQRFDNLQDDYYELELDYRLEKELRIGNSLESYYDNLRDGLGPTGSKYWWYTPSEGIWQPQADFAANLALHDLWELYWPDYETEYVEAAGENSYETAWNTLSLIYEAFDISSYDTPDEKITKILSFLDEHIHYESEINDVFLAPVETLGFKSGDCDDYSILASALFEIAGVESAIGLFKNDDDDYHAMVLVHLDDLGDYGYWRYDDLTGLGLPEGQWIMIEPQSTISYQSDEWISQWNILVAAQVEYDN
jgi:hypothetical protein